jgi:hypothetical protein
MLDGILSISTPFSLFLPLVIFFLFLIPLIDLHSNPVLRSYLPFALLNHFNIFNHWFSHFGFNLANLSFRYLDKGFLELFGPLGLVHFFHYLAFLLSLFTTGFLSHYSFLLLLLLIDTYTYWWFW